MRGLLFGGTYTTERLLRAFIWFEMIVIHDGKDMCIFLTYSVDDADTFQLEVLGSRIWHQLYRILSLIFIVYEILIVDITQYVGPFQFNLCHNIDNFIISFCNAFWCIYCTRICRVDYLAHSFYWIIFDSWSSITRNFMPTVHLSSTLQVLLCIQSMYTIRIQRDRLFIPCKLNQVTHSGIKSS